jgi:hypothetical protein
MVRSLSVNGITVAYRLDRAMRCQGGSTCVLGPVKQTPCHRYRGRTAGVCRPFCVHATGQARTTAVRRIDSSPPRGAGLQVSPRALGRTIQQALFVSRSGCGHLGSLIKAKAMS